jgi:hypothetical protein
MIRTTTVLKGIVFAALCSLAVIAGLRNANANYQAPGTCYGGNCNVVQQQPSGGCVAYQGQLCDFSNSPGGQTIWCYGTTQNGCTIIEPVNNNSCTGTCVMDGSVACSISWNICSNPRRP